MRATPHLERAPVRAPVRLPAPGPDAVTAWVRRAYPDAADDPVRRRVRVPSFQQHVERVEVRLAGGAATAYLRVYRGLCSWWTGDAPDLPEREWAAWRLAAAAGVPVAPVRLTLPETDAEPAVAVCDRVRGRGAWRRPSAALAHDLAAVLAALHGATAGGSYPAALPDLAVETLLARYAAWAVEAGDAAMADRVRSVGGALARAERRGGERASTLVHGDPYLGNWLAAQGRVTALLDWEETGVGDPRIDVAQVAASLRAEGAGAGPALAACFLTAYAERTGATVGDLEPWEALLRLRAAATRRWLEYRVGRGLPTPRTSLHSWLALRAD